MSEQTYHIMAFQGSPSDTVHCGGKRDPEVVKCFLFHSLLSLECHKKYSLTLQAYVKARRYVMSGVENVKLY